jgi:O-antigen/teichoic acid export membrane protein
MFSSSVLALGMTLTVDYAILNLRIEPREVLGVVLRFCAGLILPSLVGAVGVYALLSGSSTTARVGALVFVAMTPLGVLQACLISFLLAQSALGALTFVRITPLLINFVGVILLALVGQLTLFTYLSVTLFGVLATLVVSARVAGLRPRRGGRMRPLLRHGLRAYLGSLAYLANGQLDQALIAPVLGASDLGLYAVAVTMSNLPLGVVQAVSARSMLSMADPEGGLDPGRAAQAVRRSIVLAVVGVVGVAVIVPVFVPVLYGDAFRSVVGLTMVLLIGTVALAVTTISTMALNVAGRPGVSSVAELVGLLATGAGLLLLLPGLGVMGASIASTVAYWVRAGVQLIVLRRTGVGPLTPSSADAKEVMAMLFRVVQPIRRLRARG